MPRPKIPVILKKNNAIKRFNSITEAAIWLGVKTPCIIQLLKQSGRQKYVRGFSVEYDNENAQQKEPKELKGDNTKYVGIEVEIGGITYCSKSISDKVNCTACDIFKARPPRNMAQVPLCYEHSIGKRRVYNYCESNHTLLWIKQQ